MTENNPRRARIAVLYPWTGLPAMDRGASRRVVPMVRLLADHFHDVAVLSPGEGPDIVEGSLRFLYYQPRIWEKRLTALAHYWFDGAIHWLGRGRVSVRERRQWWHYLQPRLLPSLSCSLRGLLEQADVVLLEYPFWSRRVHQAMRGRARPLILTMHDFLSDAVASPWLRKRVLRNELAACRQAQEVICCARADQEKLRGLGFEAEFVPHGLDLATRPAAGPVDREDPLMARVESHCRSGGLACLFVGSSLQPNRDAVEAIKTMAGQLSGEASVLFVVAGDCCGLMTVGRNFIALGHADEAMLGRLYSLCEIVLAPLASGTGASLKVLEALVHRRVLVATSLAVRSHGMVPGEHAIICDDLACYPDLIMRLQQSSGERGHLAAGGWNFVQSFEYRKVYQAYVDAILKLLEGKRPA